MFKPVTGSRQRKASRCRPSAGWWQHGTTGVPGNNSPTGTGEGDVTCVSPQPLCQGPQRPVRDTQFSLAPLVSTRAPSSLREMMGWGQTGPWDPPSPWWSNPKQCRPFPTARCVSLGHWVWEKEAETSVKGRANFHTSVCLSPFSSHPLGAKQGWEFGKTTSLNYCECPLETITAKTIRYACTMLFRGREQVGLFHF